MKDLSARIPAAPAVVFNVTFRPQRGVDGIRGLRRLLKFARRSCDLIAVSCVERTELAPAAQRQRRHERKRAEKERSEMDARKWLSSTYLKVEDVKDGPTTGTIVGVRESEQFDKPVIELEDGSCLSLNQTNLKTMIQELHRRHQRMAKQKCSALSRSDTLQGHNDALHPARGAVIEARAEASA